MAALRSTLAAIDNAEAVVHTTPLGEGLAIEQTPKGVGAAEADRRSLTEAEVEAIVRAEISDRQVAADEYERRGRTERAGVLRAEIDVLAAYVGAASQESGSGSGSTSGSSTGSGLTT
jgi:uncharacterized protein